MAISIALGSGCSMGCTGAICTGMVVGMGMVRGWSGNGMGCDKNSCIGQKRRGGGAGMGWIWEGAWKEKGWKKEEGRNGKGAWKEQGWSQEGVGMKMGQS